MFDSSPALPTVSPPAPLLIAALALLNRRCRRNDLNAARLLQRAALSLTLSPSEREVCQSLAEELETQC